MKKIGLQHKLYGLITSLSCYYLPKVLSFSVFLPQRETSGVVRKVIFFTTRQWQWKRLLGLAYVYWIKEGQLPVRCWNNPSSSRDWTGTGNQIPGEWLVSFTEEIFQTSPWVKAWQKNLKIWQHKLSACQFR